MNKNFNKTNKTNDDNSYLKNLEKLEPYNNFNKEKENLFKKIQNISNEQKEDLDYRIKIKGILIFKDIIKFLTAIKREVNYVNIMSLFVYDKRLRETLYKFISFIEEMIRAKVVNKFNLQEEELKGLYKLTFWDLIDSSSRIKVLDKDLSHINTLRNAVFHNRFILICKGKINNSNIDLIKNLYIFFDSDEKIKKAFYDEVQSIYFKKCNKKYLLKKIEIPDSIILHEILKKQKDNLFQSPSF